MSFLVGGVVCRHPARATRDQTRYASPHIPRGLDRLTRSLVAQQVKSGRPQRALVLPPGPTLECFLAGSTGADVGPSRKSA